VDLLIKAKNRFPYSFGGGLSGGKALLHGNNGHNFVKGKWSIENMVS